MIRVSVGGQVFCTLRTTLSDSSFFASLLSNKFGAPECDERGALFVDRSPELFPVVLEYLRRRCVLSLPAGVSLERLLDEALFYGYEGSFDMLASENPPAESRGWRTSSSGDSRWRQARKTTNKSRFLARAKECTGAQRARPSKRRRSSPPLCSMQTISASWPGAAPTIWPHLFSQRRGSKRGCSTLQSLYAITLLAARFESSQVRSSAFFFLLC